MSPNQTALLSELAEHSSYWGTAVAFVNSILGRDEHTLSDKQLDWLHDIVANLDAELNRREARVAFGYPVHKGVQYTWMRRGENGRSGKPRADPTTRR